MPVHMPIEPHAVVMLAWEILCWRTLLPRELNLELWNCAFMCDQIKKHQTIQQSERKLLAP
jgi:hypothetical protein